MDTSIEKSNLQTKLISTLEKNSENIIRKINCLVENLKKYKYDKDRFDGLCEIKEFSDSRLRLLTLNALTNTREPKMIIPLLNIVAIICRNKQNMPLIGKEGGIKTIIMLMDLFQNHAEIQKEACAALRNLSLIRANIVLIGHKGIGMIIKAMKLYPHHFEIQCYTCAALWNLAKEIYEETIINNGAIPAILDAMKHYHSSSEYQYYACAALSNIANNIGGNLIQKGGGIDLILRAMKNHGNCVDVQEKACTILLNMVAGGHEGNIIEISNKGGIELVLGAMKFYPNHFEIQNHGTGFLWGVSIVADNGPLIVKAEGIELTIKALKNHQNYRELEDSVSSVMRNLAILDEGNEDLMNNLGYFLQRK